MRKKLILPCLLTLFVFSAIVTSAGNNAANDESAEMPEKVQVVVDKSCFGCHNTGSKNDDAKEKLDFKKLEGLSLIKKVSAYKNIEEAVEENEMPPKKFLERRPEKKLTDAEKKILMDWAKAEATALVKGK